MTQTSEEVRELQEEAVYNAISSLTLDDAPIEAEWSELDALSSRTFFEAIEAAPGGIVIKSDGSFEAAATIYVTLNYGPSRDSVSMSDSYPAMIYGRISDDMKVDIERFSADTASFYGE